MVLVKGEFVIGLVVFPDSIQAVIDFLSYEKPSVTKERKFREAIFVVPAGTDIIEPDCMHNKPITYSTRKRISIRLEKLE